MKLFFFANCQIMSDVKTTFESEKHDDDRLKAVTKRRRLTELKMAIKTEVN